MFLRRERRPRCHFDRRPGALVTSEETSERRVVFRQRRFERMWGGDNRLLCGDVAEGLGFEPRVGCPTMVFETIRFGRSRIPPGPAPTRDAGRVIVPRAPPLTLLVSRARRPRAGQPRRATKNSSISAAASPARTPSRTSMAWLSRGSLPRL